MISVIVIELTIKHFSSEFTICDEKVGKYMKYNYSDLEDEFNKRVIQLVIRRMALYHSDYTKFFRKMITYLCWDFVGIFLNRDTQLK